MRSAACLLLVIWSGSAVAHPVPRQHHDRTLTLTIRPGALLVEYVLALDQLTFDDDLAFKRDIDRADPRKLRAVYGEEFGKHIRDSLLAEINGRDLSFRFLRFEPKIEEDHLRYTFLFQASLPSALDPTTRRLFFRDGSYTGEAGAYVLTVRAEAPVQIKSAKVHGKQSADPSNVASIMLPRLIVEPEDPRRTAEATFLAPLGSTASVDANAPATADLPPAPGLWELVASFNVRRLLDSDVWFVQLLPLAFFFGTIHALQPGHGKTLVAAYLVGERGTVGHALFLGLVTTLTHTAMVFLLAIVVPLIWPGDRPEVIYALSLTCGIVVVLLSLWLLFRRLGGQADHVHLFGGHHHHHGDHDHHHHHHLPEPGSKVGWGALALLGMTGGLVPCVDALALLTATWRPGYLHMGLPLITAFSLGLASVLVLVGVMVVKFKRFAGSRWGEGRVVRSLPIVSALLTLGLGLWMCHDAQRQRAEAAAVTQER